jgi:hypothetical protein
VSSLNQYLPIWRWAFPYNSRNSKTSAATQAYPLQLKVVRRNSGNILGNSGTSAATLTAVFKSTLLLILVGLNSFTIVGPSKYILSLGISCLSYIRNNPLGSRSSDILLWVSPFPPDHSQISQATHPPTESTWDLLRTNLSAVSIRRFFPLTEVAHLLRTSHTISPLGFFLFGSFLADLHTAPHLLLKFTPSSCLGFPIFGSFPISYLLETVKLKEGGYSKLFRFINI